MSRRSGHTETSPSPAHRASLAEHPLYEAVVKTRTASRTPRTRRTVARDSEKRASVPSSLCLSMARLASGVSQSVAFATGCQAESRCAVDGSVARWHRRTPPDTCDPMGCTACRSRVACRVSCQTTSLRSSGRAPAGMSVGVDSLDAADPFRVYGRFCMSVRAIGWRNCLPSIVTGPVTLGPGQRHLRSHPAAQDRRVAVLVLAAAIDHDLHQPDARREGIEYADGLMTLRSGRRATPSDEKRVERGRISAPPLPVTGRSARHAPRA